MPTHAFSHYNLRGPLALVEELRGFYCDVVGLAIGRRPPLASVGYWLYAGDQAVLHLSVARPGEKVDPTARTTFDHAAFRCSGRPDYEHKMSERGVSYRKVHLPEGGVQLFLQDPAGNGVELFFPADDTPASS
jgi:extradiol dioxygenase family protein